mgnify:CR=1 FL=1
MGGNFDHCYNSAFYDMESFGYWPTERIYGMVDERTHVKYAHITYRKRICNYFEYAKGILGQNNTACPDRSGIERKIPDG